MRYREKLNIILMRDNGPRRNFHIRRSNFLLLTVFFLSLPFIAIALSAQCYVLWQENVKLREGVERFETDYQDAEARAERLENLEQFLDEDSVAGREPLLRQLASKALPPEQPKDDDHQAAEQHPELAEGPGHEEFPALDTGRVIVGNVQARAMGDKSLRVSADLRNPDNEPLLSGEVTAVLLTANGERMSLTFAPKEVGTFRISRFKRTVMRASIPRGTSLVNAQIILEVKDQADKPLYRNIFAVQY